ncbi:histone-like nucleoid-structuring protein Lsr2 [Amycolatopsis sp. lyj-23]|uniref:histone-like nucleoid-structuring protein Lsr2 n=1 Tax=Amycolatopsis sp. lyj-23 TaxID=2789283 RepID=UPI00397CB932
MAQKVLVKVFDDLDGSEASETIVFGLDGVSYEIDLSAENTHALRAALERYVEAARRVGGRRVKVALGESSAVVRGAAVNAQRHTREYNQGVREWAAANGYEVAERGRLPTALVEAYEAAR